jgi:MtrB/PioB family decaheme-associated outer membrane protein
MSMTTHSHRRVLRLGVLASALALVFPAARAADDELADLLRPDSTVRLGVGYLSDDNLRLGPYSGLRAQGAYALGELQVVRRDDASGTWFRASARNLGLRSPEARVELERQGEWGGFVDFSRISRFDPLVITTGLAGIGTSMVTPKGTALREVQLSTERDRFTLGFDRRLLPGVDFQLRYRGESKDGSRLFGRGSGEFLAEPIGSRTHQLEATLGYVGESLQLSGGYYGTAFLNRWAALDVASGVDISLPPDSQSHQLYLSGGYSLGPATRATFKLARSRGIQNDGFYTKADFPGNGQTSLNGRVDTHFAQVGLSTRPLPALSLLVNLRYEDREDKTPRYPFMPASAGRDGFNTPFSRTNTNGRVEASWQLPQSTRLIGSVDYDERKRSVLAIRQASWRERNDETTYRLELRRGLSDTLNGALSVWHAARGGSDYLPANNNAAADVIDPLHFADRRRDKVRLSLDWAPVEPLSLQLMVDDARDEYAGRPLGPQKGKARLLSLDANLTLSEAWQVVGWVSRDDTHIHQATITGANAALVAAQTWQARLRNTGDALGLGLRGKPLDRVEFGADVQWARDLSRYGVEATVPAAVVLPDITSRRQTLKFFGQFAVSSALAVRLDLGHDRLRTNDWTWAGWTYADGSSVYLNPRQSSSFVAVSLQVRL